MTFKNNIALILYINLSGCNHFTFIHSKSPIVCKTISNPNKSNLCGITEIVRLDQAFFPHQMNNYLN